MIKVVLDTNILISSIFWSGIPRQIVDLAVAGKFKAMTSIEILKEIEFVLIKKFSDVPYQRVRDIVRDVLSYSQLVVAEELTIAQLRDIKDIPIIACALIAKADYIVTGDNDLLVLKEFKGTKILNARSFLNIIS